MPSPDIQLAIEEAKQTGKLDLCHKQLTSLPAEIGMASIRTD